jgi:zinc/manganese transport system ATP-binding protein
MRALLGLAPLSAGTISIFGQPPGRANREIGTMPQRRATLEGTALSPRTLVAAVRDGHRWGWPWPTAVARAEVDRALALSGVAAYADKPFGVLSGGEQQRVTLAQALLGSPRLLILDEPLASLDPRNQLLLVERVARIRAETGATVLFIAHDINPLLGVMDRVLYVAGGTATLGSVDEIVTSKRLSALYGTDIHVVRAEGRIFIVSAESGVTESARHA